MKHWVMSACAVAVLSAMSSGEVWANPQHERMRQCSQEAKQQALRGDERKAFMSTCLKGKHTPAEVAPAPTAAKPVAAEPQAVAPLEPKVTGQKETVQKETVATETVSADKGGRNRMKECNQQAGERTLKGAERKAFMSECLKG